LETSAFRNHHPADWSRRIFIITKLAIKERHNYEHAPMRQWAFWLRSGIARIGPGRADLDRFLIANEGAPSHERLTLIRISEGGRTYRRPAWVGAKNTGLMPSKRKRLRQLEEKHASRSGS
jgi:hypothetical protein